MDESKSTSERISDANEILKKCGITFQEAGERIAKSMNDVSFNLKQIKDNKTYTHQSKFHK